MRLDPQSLFDRNRLCEPSWPGIRLVVRKVSSFQDQI